MGEDYETAWVEGVKISFCVFVYYIILKKYTE
jgi:hypothetical protein